MRKLVAALACRINGSRLYGKPVQALDIGRQISVLEHMIVMLRSEPSISDIVLGVSEGAANAVFHDIAVRHGLASITGNERDVLQRLIQCADAVSGTDVFRVTTESPFTYLDPIGEAWRRHVEHANDATVIDGVPEGTAFEIFTADALRRSHAEGTDRHRSEMCSLYIRENRDRFRVEVLPVSESVLRMDIRLTIDYPEDLVLCRRVYAALAQYAPRLPLDGIIAFLDREPRLKDLVAPYVVEKRLY